MGEDGGVRLADHIAMEFDVLGLASEHFMRWLAAQRVRRRVTWWSTSAARSAT
ncbi:MAG TPA: hypothetical protein VK988_15380 [Acidimicrobiales bacterium]|nr:hypothetical protein [Acidimicrobiales bacterium]